MGNRQSILGRKKKKKEHKLQDFENNNTDDSSSDDYESVLEIDSEPIDLTSVKDCWKEDKHKNYIPFEKLTINHIPEPIHHSAVLEYIQARGKLVVKIVILEQSKARESNDDVICKTGFLNASGYACVCEEEPVVANCPLAHCKLGGTKNHKVYGGILVTTNKHVIVDDFECENSKFYFNYEPESTTVVGNGYCLRDYNANKDYVGVNVFVHDPGVVEQIRKSSSDAVLAWHKIPSALQVNFEDLAVIISHPHGWTKQVSFGEMLHKEQLRLLEDDNVNNKNNNKKPSKETPFKHRRVSRYTCLTCKGSSGAPILTGLYWNNPFVHSRTFREIENKKHYFYGESYFY